MPRVLQWLRSALVLGCAAWSIDAVPSSAAGPPSPATLFVVGDVMYRDTSEGAERVGRLLEKSLAETAGYGAAFVVGDFCNDDGAADCYDRLDATSWGALRPLIYTVPGNHDYQDAQRIAGSIPYYFQYVLRGGERMRGWHAFDWGGWRIIGLNSEVMGKDADDKLSPLGIEQMKWFDRELKEHSRNQCILTAYHRPMFSSGRFGSPAWVAPIFRRSYNYGVDLYVVGHEHFFAHMPKLTPFNGPDNLALADPTYGIEGLIVGTGGAVLFPHPTVDPRIKKAERRLKWAKYDEEVLANHWGIVRIDLAPGTFTWRFIPVSPEPGRVYPSGSGVCHANPPGYQEPAIR